MTNKNYNHTELVWDGKFEESIKLPKKRTIDKIVLPFQTIEVINEPREGTGSSQLFSGKKKEGWRNKLIWGDNELAVSSLIKDFSGSINLIYIDPPFFTGSNMPIQISVGEEEESLLKKPSMIEEVAYRNIWRYGLASFCDWIYKRMYLMRELLSHNGSIFVRFDYHYSHYVKIILDDIFGKSNFRNELIINRTKKIFPSKQYNVATDSLFWYSKSDNWFFNPVYKNRDKNNLKWINMHSPGERKPPERFIDNKKIYPPRGRHWTFTQKLIERMQKEGRIRIKNNIEYIDIKGKTIKGMPQYLMSEKELLDTNWTDIPGYSFKTGYPTENSEQLLERVIRSASAENDLVADFFSGSGTTATVAEQLGRRWIACDIGRFSIHTCRKRLMEIQRKSKESSKDYYPFEVLNLGKYERQYWQTALLNKSKETDESKKIVQYIKFIIELYKGEIITGFKNIHGKKDNSFIHIGAVDAPVTMNEIKETVEECKKNKFTNLDILGWEWEMGVNEEAIKWAKGQSVKLRLLQIPREVMEKRVAETGDVRFFELNYVEVDAIRKGQEVKVALKNFAIPSEEFIPNELRDKIEKWSDYIDYWSVDWDYESLKSKDGEPIFENDWQTFRTKKNPKLELETPSHKYNKKGKYLILVKVIDIFGNDTSKVVEVKI